MNPVPIPESHRDLIDGNYNVALTTLMPDGQPQTTPVWGNREGDYILINTMRSFQKHKNMAANPQVTLLAYDPHNPLHNLEIRGLVEEMTEDGALAHLDQLTSKYLHQPDAHFFGDSIPASLAEHYIPTRVRIMPTYVRVEG
jgi:PPOX class probable F420-dependent enzyme